jgi:hypothetical protein
MDNIQLEKQAPASSQQTQVPITEVPINDDNTALNVMVTFLSIAQKRGTFSIDESAKVWEAIKRFVAPSGQTPTQTSTSDSSV